ncbi:glycosyltransferase involved in cell wall biosynthesis [Pedobacter sp. CAN_A7]|uniref:glycosyltransferase family 2 protein n=1 Tax=Pedobacter sp. CAN_A7 TaxID=2787722 RepID=UPI0018CA15AE
MSDINIFSVIIPTYNRAHLIKRAIESIVAQTYMKWELIIVDDGSTDQTEQIISPFLVDNRIKYVKKENSGAAKSRNIGVKNSSGNWVTFLDSDDEAYPSWLDEISRHIAVPNVQLICCGSEIVDHSGRLIAISLPAPKIELFGQQDYKMTNGGVFIIRRDIFDEIGGFDDELQSSQHTELSFRLIPFIQEIKGEITNVYKPLIKIHIHLGERIRGNSKMKYLGTKYMLEKHADFLLDKKVFRSNFEGAVGYNAYVVGQYSDSFKFLLKAFSTKPTFKKLIRLCVYSAKISLKKIKS